MRRVLVGLLLLCGCLIGIPVLAQKPSLKGSASSVKRMAEQEKAHDFTRLSTGAKVRAFFRGGYLVELKGNGNYFVDDQVSYPLVRPEVKLFVERVSGQFREACGSVLWVTSGSRPIDEQPSNASKKSVHPSGMAIDFRIPRQGACRRWLEAILLALEGKRVLEATREKSPPHYHVAVFPKPYKEYVEGVKAGAKKKAAGAEPPKKKVPPAKKPVRRK